MSKKVTGSVIFTLLGFVAIGCMKLPAKDRYTDSNLPGPLRVANDVSQCPELSGVFTFEKSDGTIQDIEINLDLKETPPVLTLNNSQFTVDGESHDLDSLNDYQVGCSEGTLVVQYSMDFLPMSKTEYRMESDSLVIIRKSLNANVKILDAEKSIGTRKVLAEKNEN